MNTTIKNININGQAKAVLALLEKREIDHNIEAYVCIDTSVWYNGRERGYALSVYRLGKIDGLVITFGEHRNSDNIFVDSWVTTLSINPPTVADFTDDAYKNRVNFRYGECGAVVRYILSTINMYIETLEE